MGNVPDKNPEAGIAEQDICIEERPMAVASSRPRSRPFHQISGPCEHGYDDQQFEDDISENFHCAICTNVLKDPVMCFRNEHIFCRACITKYLAKSRTCPTCIEPLTVDTLRVPPRIVLNCLSEFKIRCNFYNRGCREIVQWGKLERHVKECEFAPAVCSNEGCHMEVNRRDIIHHETSICEMRRVQCHNCTELKQEMETARRQLTTLTKKLDGIEAKQDKLILDVNDKLDKLELNAQQLEADNEGIKKNLTLVVEHLGRLAKASSNEASCLQKEKQTSSIAAKVVKSNLKVIVAGGSGTGEQILSSVEMFDVAKGMWTMLQPMKECRASASSVVYNNQIVVSGGWTKTGGTKTMEALPSADQVTQLVTWKEYPAVLPNRTYGHGTVVCNDQLITVGGLTLTDDDVRDISKYICDVSLAPPYSLKDLVRMQHKRLSHGMHLINGKLVVVGGETFYNTLDSVLLYDLIKNESTELAPLPYPVSEMATVSWGDNIMIIGGAGFWNVYPRRALQVLDRVVIYNVSTQKSRDMRKMKYKRRGATAVKIGNDVYVMGGVDENDKGLKSVECYNIERNSWQEVPSMHEARYRATAVVC